MGDNQSLQVIADNIKNIDKQIAEVRELIDFLEEAKQDVSKPRSQLAALILEKGNWESALRNRGYI